MTPQIFIKSSVSTYVLNVDLSSTVLDVKSKLKKQEGIPEIRQRYLHGYLEFQYSDILRHYNIYEPRTLMMTVILTNGTSMLLVLIFSCIMYLSIYINVNRYRLITLDVVPDDTIETLKRKVKRVKTSDISSFYFAGTMPNNKTLLECNITDKSTIHLLLETQNTEQSQIYNNVTKMKNVTKNYNSLNDVKKQYLEMIQLSKPKNGENQRLLPQVDQSKAQTDCCSCVVL
eukprot:24452_1